MSDSNITVYGANWCGDCRRAKKFLGEQRIHYNWVDIEQHPELLEIKNIVEKGEFVSDE